MTLPVLTSGKSGREYLWPPNADVPELVVPSVTTILQEEAKPFLTPWAAKLAAEYAYDKRDALAALDREEFVQLVKGASNRYMYSRANVGNLVHAALENHVNGDEIVHIDTDALPYFEAGISFLKELDVRADYVEATIFSRKYQYAGSCDLFGSFDWEGERHYGPIDWKTSKRIYPATALQLVAYANGDFIGTPDSVEHEIADTTLGLVVHLQPSGKWEAHPVQVNDQRLMKTFAALRTIHHWKYAIESTALGTKKKGTAKKIGE